MNNLSSAFSDPSSGEVESYLTTMGIAFKSKGKELLLSECPICGKYEKNSITRQGLWHCFACGEKGNFTTFRRTLEGASSRPCLLHREPSMPRASKKEKKLYDNHRQDLNSSGLSDEMIHRCGFYSTDNTAEFIGRDLGKALVIPYPGNSEFARIKPDNPRIDEESGRKIKYEQRPGTINHLYVPDGSGKDGNLPLVIVEGEKKAAKGQQEFQGEYEFIGISGVYSFKLKDKKNEAGYVIEPGGLIPDFETIPLKNRKVIIIFDSDRKDKPDLRKAEHKLGVMLAERGAKVEVMILPHTPTGKKQGLDDFLINEGKNAFYTLPCYPVGDRTKLQMSGTEYEFSKRGYNKLRYTKDGEEIRLKLCNFTVHFDSKVKFLDDSEEISDYILRGFIRSESLKQDSHFEWRIGASDSISDCIKKSLPTGCFLEPKSKQVVEELANYFNLGCREIEAVEAPGRYKDKFITSSIIIEDGKPRRNNGSIPVISSKSRFSGRYDLLTIPDSDLPEARELVFNDILNFHHPEVTLPMLGIIGLAPINNTLGVPNFTVFLEGITEAGKSVTLKVFTNFFADLDIMTGSLPSVTSTIADLEVEGWHAKDMIFPVDDLKLEVIKGRERDVVTLIQGAYDRHGRGRRQRNMARRQEYYIRGIPVMTGEEILSNVSSIINRMFIIRVKHHRIDRETLHRLNEKRHLLRGLMTRYIAWLQRQEKGYVKLIPAPAFSISGGRTESFSKQILTGLHYFLEFAVSDCGLSANTANEIFQKTTLAVSESLSSTQYESHAQKKHERFIEILRELYARGEVNFDQRNETGINLGFYGEMGNEDVIFVLPNSAVQRVREECHSIDISIPSMGKDLKESNFIVSDNDGNPRVTKYFSFKRQVCRMWAIRRDLFEGQPSDRKAYDRKYPNTADSDEDKFNDEPLPF